ncbi:sterile alpha motif domain-containing protein 3-like [Ixodes scapularis]|uniref:sterile alpha motif domain-containing protein 3-like n=1 Tax=Ixodes scapularis TaxID=6945 RepID=UPI001A9DC1CD|nr:sterile alpha motif domain-containing protein 3-like [Ixodes scapularis]
MHVPLFSGVLDTDLGEYLDWDIDATLSAGSKIRAPLLAPRQPTPPPASVADAPEVPAPPTLRAAIIEEGLSPTLDPRKYMFPAIPKDIEHNLSEVKTRTDLRPELRFRIVEWLCLDLFRYTLYPGKLYERAAQQLVLRHKVLADAIGSGHDSWHSALKYKWKYERAKIENDGAVTSNKQKFGKKPSSQDAANGSESAKRACRQPEKLETPSEDEHSIQGHIRSMQKELSKDVPNMEKVQDGMSRTFSARRQWRATEHPSVPEILSRYPALEGAEVSIFRELERFGGDPPVQTTIAVAEKQVNTALDAAAKKAGKTTFEMLEKAEVCDTEGQKCATFFKYPCVVWDGVLSSPGPCMVQVENQLLKVDHPVHAILVAFCLLWAVDMCYQPAAMGFYSLVEHLLGLPATKPAGMVLTTLSAMKEALKKK